MGLASISNSPAVDASPQRLVQAIAGHDVRLAAKDFRCPLFDVHQPEQTERTLLVVEEQIDVRIIPRLIAGGRAEQVKMLDTEPPQLGLVLLQPGDDILALHGRYLGWQRTHGQRSAFGIVRSRAKPRRWPRPPAP